MRGLEVAVSVVSLLVLLAPGEELPRLHDVSVPLSKMRKTMTSLGSLLHRWFDEFRLQVNRQYVKGAKVVFGK